MPTSPGEAAGTRSLQRMRSRQRLLEAAVERMSERGTSGTSVQDVAALAGFTSGAVYHQFSSREDLVRAASSYALAQHPRLEDLADSAASVGDFLVATAAAALQLLDDDASGVRDLFRVQIHLLLSASHDEDAREVMTTFIDGQVEELAGRIAAAADAHAQQLVVQPENVAREFLALVRGFMVLRIAEPALATDATVESAVARLAATVTAWS